MIFWIGFFVMVFNEGFVIMRHQSKFFAQLRDELIKEFGDGWKKFHSTMDWIWLGGVILGLILAGNQRLTDIVALVTFWGCVLFFVYIPKWIGQRLFRQKNTPKIFRGFLVFNFRFSYIIPRDPAVIPTAIKNPNSNRPCASAGVDINMLLKYERTDGSIVINVCSDQTEENKLWHSTR